MAGPTAVERAAQRLHELATSGEPAPRSDNWHCGLCGGGYDEGVRMFTREIRVERPGRKPLIDFKGIMVCPCCSSTDCAHRPAAAAVPA